MTQRILVVDDSPFIQELTKDILTKAGFDVGKASAISWLFLIIIVVITTFLLKYIYRTER